MRRPLQAHDIDILIEWATKIRYMIEDGKLNYNLSLLNNISNNEYIVCLPQYELFLYLTRLFDDSFLKATFEWIQHCRKYNVYEDRYYLKRSIYGLLDLCKLCLIVSYEIGYETIKRERSIIYSVIRMVYDGFMNAPIDESIHKILMYIGQISGEINQYKDKIKDFQKSFFDDYIEHRVRDDKTYKVCVSFIDPDNRRDLMCTFDPNSLRAEPIIEHFILDSKQIENIVAREFSQEAIVKCLTNRRKINGSSIKKEE